MHQKPIVDLFRYILKINFLAEKNISTQNNTLYKFCEKWKNIVEDLK